MLETIGSIFLGLASLWIILALLAAFVGAAIVGWVFYHLFIAE